MRKKFRMLFGLVLFKVVPKLGSDILSHPFRKVNKKCSSAILLSVLDAKGSLIAEVYLRKIQGLVRLSFIQSRFKVGVGHPSSPLQKS